MSNWLSLSLLCESRPGAGAGRFSLHRQEMDGLALKPSRVRPCETQGWGRVTAGEQGGG